MGAGVRRPSRPCISFSSIPTQLRGDGPRGWSVSAGRVAVPRAAGGSSRFLWDWWPSLEWTGRPSGEPRCLLTLRCLKSYGVWTSIAGLRAYQTVSDCRTRARAACFRIRRAERAVIELLGALLIAVAGARSPQPRVLASALASMRAAEWFVD